MKLPDMRLHINDIKKRYTANQTRKQLIYEVVELERPLFDLLCTLYALLEKAEDLMNAEETSNDN